MSNPELPRNFGVADFIVVPPTAETRSQLDQTLQRVFEVCNVTTTSCQEVKASLGRRDLAYASVEAEVVKTVRDSRSPLTGLEEGQTVTIEGKTIDSKSPIALFFKHINDDLTADHGSLIVKVEAPAARGSHIRHFYARSRGFEGKMSDETYGSTLGRLSELLSATKMQWLQNAIDIVQGACAPAEPALQQRLRHCLPRPE